MNSCLDNVYAIDHDRAKFTRNLLVLLRMHNHFSQKESTVSTKLSSKPKTGGMQTSLGNSLNQLRLALIEDNFEIDVELGMGLAVYTRVLLPILNRYANQSDRAGEKTPLCWNGSSLLPYAIFINFDIEILFSIF